MEVTLPSGIEPPLRFRSEVDRSVDSSSKLKVAEGAGPAPEALNALAPVSNRAPHLGGFAFHKNGPRAGILARTPRFEASYGINSTTRRKCWSARPDSHRDYCLVRTEDDFCLPTGAWSPRKDLHLHGTA